MSFHLRPYQSALIDEMRELMKAGNKSILCQSPTGSGKTALTAHMLKTAAEKKMPSWFLVHRRELVKQSIQAFDFQGIPYGVVANGFHYDSRPLIHIGTIGTIARASRHMRVPRLIIWDECHHLAAKSWARIREQHKTAYHIGLTATPERLDGKGLSDWFSAMVNGPSTAKLIGDGFLCPYKLYAPSTVNLEGVHTRMGDFVRNEVAAAIDKPTITGDAISHYKRLADGKRAVVFCVSIEHSKHVAAQFVSAGITAAHIDGETQTEVRDALIEKFRAGTIQVLCNVELFGEGFDLPALEVAILLRPTQSLALYLQQVGRALRPMPGKDHAVILDHAGNSQRHGLPEEEREWSLSGREKTRRKLSADDLRVRVCPACYAVQLPGKVECEFCGHKFEIKSREVDHRDGELVEVDKAEFRRHQKLEQSACKTFQELIALGTKRKMKHPYMWAKYIWQARQNRKLMGAA